MDKLLTRAGFERWLAAKEGMDYVGQPGNAAQCPLAHYLRDQGFEDVMVRENYYVLDGLNEFSAWLEELPERFPLAPWAQDLVRLVDSYTGLATVMDASRVRGLLALIDKA